VTTAEDGLLSPIRVELDGHAFEGVFKTLSGTVVVYFEGGVKYAALGADRPEIVARWLLTDLCTARRGRDVA
jgi:hypothetical protein